MLAVSVARLYLGVHYLADVVAGALFGMVLVWVYRPVWTAVEGKLGEWPFGVYVGLGLLAIAGAIAGYVLGFYGSNPFKWHAGGLVAGGTIALLLESRSGLRVSEPDGRGWCSESSSAWPAS